MVLLQMYTRPRVPVHRNATPPRPLPGSYPQRARAHLPPPAPSRSCTGWVAARGGSGSGAWLSSARQVGGCGTPPQARAASPPRRARATHVNCATHESARMRAAAPACAMATGGEGCGPPPRGRAPAAEADVPHLRKLCGAGEGGGKRRGERDTCPCGQGVHARVTRLGAGGRRSRRRAGQRAARAGTQQQHGTTSAAARHPASGSGTRRRNRTPRRSARLRAS